MILSERDLSNHKKNQGFSWLGFVGYVSLHVPKGKLMIKFRLEIENTSNKNSYMSNQTLTESAWLKLTDLIMLRNQYSCNL